VMARAFKSEDEVRDEAREILEFSDSKRAKSGVGQITTFNQLGFPGVNDKPDGWFLPKKFTDTAIILETKSSDKDLSKFKEELEKNLKILSQKYNKRIGILYNGYEVLYLKDIKDSDYSGADKLQSKEYYINLFAESNIDRNEIWKLTKNINDLLHFSFGMKNLNHRMVFTACALVAIRYSKENKGKSALQAGMDYDTFHSAILSQLTKSLESDLQKNSKLNILKEQFALIQLNQVETQIPIDNFIKDVTKISDHLNDIKWRGEDVMAIFFNEFTRYKGKSESGQVFTPDHIVSLIYRLTETNKNHKVLDACCGSGTFLTRAMANMLAEAGGTLTKEAKAIKQDQLFGVEFDKEIFALACANMLIHNDGKSNIVLGDSRTAEISEWIKGKEITRVLMNPPFEEKYGCSSIVENVLDSVKEDSIAAFILPDNKLEVKRKKTLTWLKKHTLLYIIKLPNIFAGMAGIATSVFIFRTGMPQGEKKVSSWWIKDDGFETVKNQGRHDTKNKWSSIEDYWVDVIINNAKEDDTFQRIDPMVSLRYKTPESPFSMTEKDYKKVMLDYILFEKQISEKDFTESILDYVLYGNIAGDSRFNIRKIVEGIDAKKTDGDVDISGWKRWKRFEIGSLFTISSSKRKFNAGDLIFGDVGYPYVARSKENNGIRGLICKDEKYLNAAGTISFGQDTATMFYQQRPYFTGDKIKILTPEFDEFNEFTALFLVAVMQKAFNNFSWGSDSYDENIIRTMTVMLPVTSKDTPHWGLMEEYMKSLKEDFLLH
jgi:type I restriction-modification system DNA methylase subunit